MDALLRRLGEIFHREGPPDGSSLGRALSVARVALALEPERIRPRDPEGRPGGLILLDRQLPTIVVPDLHGRMDFFLSVLGYEAEAGRTAIELVSAARLQILCLGDGVHAEGRATLRWREALDEFKGGFRLHRSMDAEMRESLGVMEMVMEVKGCFPDRFHFLKGNHENITNELGNGNFPFRKLALEGHMVAAYMRLFYGEAMWEEYSLFEKALPLLAAGNGFLASHAEPAAFFPRESVVDYKSNPDVISGLTWTDNNAAEQGSVQAMLAHYLGAEEARQGFHFGGHRAVSELYRLRADGRFVQIHDPDRFVIAHLPASGAIELGRDVRAIDEGSLLAV